VRPEDEFSEWYNAAIEKGDLTDKRYPIKGMNIWTAHGFAVMHRMDEHMRSEMVRTGHQEVAFPLLIPESEFKKESEHIKGFEEEVYWVTHAGKNELDIRLCLRPTSEAAMYPIFALWVRSHADLPLRTFQIVNTYRYDTKQTRAFMRVREIHFFEAHTCHADFDDAERQIQTDIAVMRNLSRTFGIPFLLSKRPDWDKFPGAYYSLACDALMPTGKTLQVATIHQYRENFAKAYDVKYENSLVKYVPLLLTAMGYSVEERPAATSGLTPSVAGTRGSERILVEVLEREAAAGDVQRMAAMRSGSPGGRVALCATAIPAEVAASLTKGGIEAWDPQHLGDLAVKSHAPPFQRHSYVHQTTYGMSERLLGAIVGLHGDAKGFTLPPLIAPIQVVIVPILAKGDQARIVDAATKLAEELSGLRVHLDLRDLRPGNKFYEWEAKGVPVRVEIGPRDLEQGVVTAVRRDMGAKATIPRANAAVALTSLLDLVQTELYARAESVLAAGTTTITALTATVPGINAFAWCGRESCGHSVEQGADMKILGTPPTGDAPAGKCIVCGEAAAATAYAAKTY